MDLQKKDMNFRSGNQYTLVVANIVLMVFLLLTIFFVMMFPQTVQRVLYQFCITGILLSAFFCIDKKYRRIIRWVIGLAIALVWAYVLTGNFTLNGISKSLVICLYFIIVILLVKQAATSKSVTRIVILESVNGYLLIGMFYSIIVALVMLFNPGAYHFQGHIENTDELLTNFNEYLYYGFNAFTTVTYGDVIPISPVAKSVSMAMGFTGQMYVTVIIAMLVGKFAGQRQKEE
jgi:voltage-gated potassium channel